MKYEKAFKSKSCRLPSIEEARMDDSSNPDEFIVSFFIVKFLRLIIRNLNFIFSIILKTLKIIWAIFTENYPMGERRRQKSSPKFSINFEMKIWQLVRKQKVFQLLFKGQKILYRWDKERQCCGGARETRWAMSWLSESLVRHHTTLFLVF